VNVIVLIATDAVTRAFGVKDAVETKLADVAEVAVAALVANDADIAIEEVAAYEAETTLPNNNEAVKANDAEVLLLANDAEVLLLANDADVAIDAVAA
jgi:hypothetical protein